MRDNAPAQRTEDRSRSRRHSQPRNATRGTPCRHRTSRRGRGAGGTAQVSKTLAEGSTDRSRCAVAVQPVDAVVAGHDEWELGAAGGVAGEDGVLDRACGVERGVDARAAKVETADRGATRTLVCARASSARGLDVLPSIASATHHHDRAGRAGRPPRATGSLSPRRDRTDCLDTLAAALIR